MRYPILSLLVFFFLAVGFVAEPAQAEAFCSPAVDRVEPGPNGDTRIVLPSFRYPEHVLHGDYIFSTERLAQNPRGFIRSYINACSDEEARTSSSIYALSPYLTTPLSIGSLCSGAPTILFRSYGQAADSPFLFIHVDSISSGFMDRAVWGKYVAQFQSVTDSDVEDGFPWRFEHDNKLEAYIVRMLGLVFSNCGEFPDSMTFKVAAGPTVKEAFYDPEYLSIEVKYVGTGWSLNFDNADRLREIAMEGSQRFSDWSRDIYDGNSREITTEDVLNFLAGLQLAAEASGQGGHLDVCNRGVSPLRISTIALIPVGKPTTFVEGYDIAEPGECARVDGDVHPRMVYGVALEVKQPDGSFRPYFGEVRDPDEGIPHKFDFVCVPEKADFVRNEVGMLTANSCRPGDRKLPISFNVRVGRTKFTMDVN